VIDELYGAIDIPEYLAPIINSPEFQRLRDVRLINMFSTSLASLSDIRRLTHTLGVMGLFLRLKPRFLKMASFDKNLCRTMEVACLVHDIATPAFAHLFEWELRGKTGWNHETQCESIVKGHYSRQNKFHQIYFKNQLSLNQRIRNLDVDPDKVWQIIRGDGQFGRLLCGTIDLDNIDNVIRMYNALGLGNNVPEIFSIVDSLIPYPESIGFKREAYPAILWWIQARKKCYDLIVFDEQTLSAQAMLGQIIAQAIDAGYLDEGHWYLTDDQLLYKLLQFKSGKGIIKRLAVGNTYAVLGIYWYDFDQEIADELGSEKLREQISNQIKNDLKLPCYLYYFVDKGTFEKRIDLMFGDSLENSENVSLGKQSHSMVIGILTPSQNDKAIANARKRITQIFESMLPKKPIRRNLPLIKSYYNGTEYQKELSI